MGIAIQDEEIKQSLIFYEEASCLKLFYSILAFFLLAIVSPNHSFSSPPILHCTSYSSVKNQPPIP